MNYLAYILINIFESLLRLFPVPSRTGIRKIGNPGRNSPVLVTGNYHLTVARVIRHLSGIDCYLLVANSRGINIWCGSAGGHFTSHNVISAIKTSGIDNLVDHRQMIMPQLAATGVEGKVINEKTGWDVIWGPVYAEDIPAFLNGNYLKTRDMSQVKFPLLQRIEMAVTWAFPLSLVGTLVMMFPWPEMVKPLIYIVWMLSLTIYISFPLYEDKLRHVSRHPGFVFFDFGRNGFQIALWFIFMAGLLIYSIVSGEFSAGFIAKWGLISLIIISILCMDITGSTPVIKSAIHDDITMSVHLDRERCRGAGICVTVCPRGCFDVLMSEHKASMPGARRCVRCGACIVQCPNDALYFRTSAGDFISPDTIRRSKLNLLGKRLRSTS